MNSKIIPLLFVFIVATPTLTFAHGNGHGKKNNSASQVEEARVLNDSIYVVDNEKDTEPSIIGEDPLGFSLSSADILSGDDFLNEVGMGSGEPMIRFEDEMDPKRKHSQHEKQKQHVEKATHEWVSPNAKGHGVAIGIAVVSGLVFVALSIFRTGEGNQKPS